MSQKNDTDVAHYNFDVDQPTLIIFGWGVAVTACYQTVMCYLTCPNQCLCTTWGNMNTENCVFSVILYTVSRKWNGRARNYLHTVLNKYDLIVYKKLLKLVDKCRRYSKSKQCRFRDMVYSMTEKDKIFGVYIHVSPGNAETLVRRGGITNHHLIAYFLGL